MREEKRKRYTNSSPRLLFEGIYIIILSHAWHIIILYDVRSVHRQRTPSVKLLLFAKFSSKFHTHTEWIVWMRPRNNNSNNKRKTSNRVRSAEETIQTSGDRFSLFMKNHNNTRWSVVRFSCNHYTMGNMMVDSAYTTRPTLRTMFSHFQLSFPRTAFFLLLLLVFGELYVIRFLLLFPSTQPFFHLLLVYSAHWKSSVTQCEWCVFHGHCVIVRLHHPR